MSRDIRAIQDEYNTVAQELSTVRADVARSMGQINADIMSIVSRGGPLHSRRISQNVTSLLTQIRTDLIVPNNAALDDLETYLNAYISGTDSYDQQ